MDSIHRRDGTRYASKKELALAVKAGEIPVIEATSEYSKGGPINQLPIGEYWVVGPSPENRKWYAIINKTGRGNIRVK